MQHRRITWKEFRTLRGIKLPHFNTTRHYRVFCLKQIEFLKELRTGLLFHKELDESIAAWEKVMPEPAFSLRHFLDEVNNSASAPHEKARKEIACEDDIHERMTVIDDCIALLDVHIAIANDVEWIVAATKGVHNLKKWKKQWGLLLRRFEVEYISPFEKAKPKKKKNVSRSDRDRELRKKMRG